MAGDSADSSGSIPASLLIDTSSYTIQQLPKLDTVKLTENTYVLWKHQVMLIVEGYGLVSFLSDHKIPDKTVVNDSGQTVTNSIYLAYLKQDKLLASWLLSMVLSDLLPHLTGLVTSRAIWDALSRRFARSSTKISSLRHSLHSQRKRGQSVSKYLAKIKLICDTLGASGNVVSDQEHVSVVLSVLSAEFESVIAVASREALTLESLSEMLFDCEARQQEFLADGMSIQANVVTRSSGKSSSYKDDEGDDPDNVSDQACQQFATSNSQNFSKGQRVNSFRGRGRGRFGNNRPQCQLCGRYGHLVHKCWYRFDQTFPGVLSGDQSSRESSSCATAPQPTGFSPRSETSSLPSVQAYNHVFLMHSSPLFSAPQGSPFLQTYSSPGSVISSYTPTHIAPTSMNVPSAPHVSSPRFAAPVMANSFSPAMSGSGAHGSRDTVCLFFSIHAERLMPPWLP